MAGLNPKCLALQSSTHQQVPQSSGTKDGTRWQHGSGVLRHHFGPLAICKVVAPHVVALCAAEAGDDEYRVCSRNQACASATLQASASVPASASVSGSGLT